MLLLALASWLWWPTGESEGVKYFTDGGDINQPVKDAKPLPSLYIPPRLVLDENEGDVDQYDPTLSADELTLIFVRGRAHPDVGADLYLARRASSSDPWGEPELLSEINTSHNEISPELSRDGRWLFFASNRPDGWGGYDIWISAREGDGWRVPLNVGAKVNTGYNEIDPAWFAKKEPGTFESGLYFASNRPKLTVAEPKAPRWEGTLRGHEPPKPDDYDIFLAKADLESGKKEADGEKTEDETGSASFLDDMPPVPTSALALKEAKRLNHVNTFAREGQPALTPGGEYLYFSSNRQEAQGNRKGRTDFDLYRAHAHLYTLGHNVPENVGPSINTVGDEMDPFLFSVTEEASLGLLFSSNRDEGDTTYQLYQSRTKPVVSMDVKKESPTPATDAGSGFTDWFKKYQWWILLLILALLALVWLLKKFLDEEQRRHLSLMQSCLLSSLMLHLLLAFLLSLWVISEAIYKVIKERTPEISVQEKQLAQERMALNLREQTTQLPQIQTPLPAEQKSEQQPVVEVRPQHPSIEIETKQATSQSFAAQPQQVQPSPAKLDKLELIEPQSNPESTPQTLMVPLEESEPQAVDSQQLAQASNEVKMAKAQAQTETAIPQALTPKPVESQPTQKMMTEAKAVPTEVKIELMSLQTIKARLNIKPPAPQALTVPLEKSDPQAVDSQRLAQGSSEVR